MSHEVNIVETAYGTLDPGVWVEIYDYSGSYDKIKVKARFFTVAPDPWLPFAGGLLEWAPNQLDLEITRVWETVWVAADGTPTFQRNAHIANVGSNTSAYRLLRAETDN
jgi:hypothetical protein